MPFLNIFSFQKKSFDFNIHTYSVVDSQGCGGTSGVVTLVDPASTLVIFIDFFIYYFFLNFFIFFYI
jgi:hypothetical protein